MTNTLGCGTVQDRQNRSQRNVNDGEGHWCIEPSVKRWAGHESWVFRIGGIATREEVMERVRKKS